jgi:histidinol-phosphatase
VTRDEVVAGTDLAAELQLAFELADLAADEALPRYRTREFTVERKADRSEVTEADRRAEAAIGARLQSTRPEHGLFGEEMGLVGDPTSPWRWIVDPIDGTANFIRGHPGVGHADRPHPPGPRSAGGCRVGTGMGGRQWWAARGWGRSSMAIPFVSAPTDRLDQAQISVTFNDGWDQFGLTDQLVDLQRCAHRGRGFGDFWQHMLVAEGAVDLAVDAVGLQAYDVAAVQVMVEEAGGMFTDRNGSSRLDTGTAVSSNGRPAPRGDPTAQRSPDVACDELRPVSSLVIRNANLVDGSGAPATQGRHRGGG